MTLTNLAILAIPVLAIGGAIAAYFETRGRRPS